MYDAPQEIIDQVIGFLQDDRKHLLVARRVCHSWNISSRVHLFNHLDLRVPDQIPERRTSCKPHSKHLSDNCSNPTITGLERFKRLLELLDTSHDVAFSARHIVLGNTGLISPEARDIYDVLIPALLSKVRRITSLQLSRMRWADVSSPMLECIANILESPHLHHLDIWNCELPNAEAFTRILSMPRSLQSLRVSQIHFKQPFNHSISSNTLTNLNVTDKPSSLRILDIETTNLTPLLEAFIASSQSQHCIKIDNVERLSIKHIRDESSVRAFLKAVGGAVEHLELKASASWDSTHNPNPHRPIELEHLPSLRSLHLLGVQWVGRLSSANRIASIFSNIPQISQNQYNQGPTTIPIPIPPSRCQSNPHFCQHPHHHHHHHLDHYPHPLEHLHISITALPMRQSIGHYDQWLALDNALSHPAFSSLQSVTIHVYLQAVWEKGFDRTKFIAQFPKLSEQGKITVDFIIPSYSYS
ncbi:hypothetical protein CVT24_002689 [Panaeolus cyanescens]|uniref:F-box domain-containing protein n=1 Tax=Panaeolus cyanescens TaxID=181874 RepID=A0A409YYG3_9AGAR|nr:hypothetical protein CVT24_002689 [Panaeolus cyanescens]